MGNIIWKIKNEVGLQTVEFYSEKDGKIILVHTEELENVIGDYVDQREDEWVGKEGE